MTGATSLTIAIPSYERRDHLARLLDSIAHAVVGVTGCEIDVLVVLDGSTDGSDDLVAGLAPGYPVGLRAVWQPNQGLASARNTAIREAAGDLVWLLDDDMVITPTALACHVSSERTAIRILMGPAEVSSPDAEVVERLWWYEDRHRRLAAAGRVTAPEDCSFANTSAPAALLREHRFDEGFRGYGLEDTELAVRLLAAGETIGFSATAAVRHEFDATRSAYLRKLREEGVNRIRFVSVHPERVEVVFRPQPGRMERVFRVFARWPAGPILWAAARVVDAMSRRLPAGGRRSWLRTAADLLAVHSGVADARTSWPRGKAAGLLRRVRAVRSVVAEWAQEKITDRIRQATLRWRIHHVHGPATIDRSPDDVLVISIVRNGLLYLPSFLAHHRALGVRHFLFLDNGSTDGTIELLRTCDDVTVLRTSARYRTHENPMKRHLVKTYSRGAWNLFVDIDELFDYPGSDRMSIDGLIGYLVQGGYTALVAQMLDMFADEPLSSTTFTGGPGLARAQPWYDVSDISYEPYVFTDRPTDVRFHRGGVRRTVFGTQNGLTKAPLVFARGGIDTFVAFHHCRHARLADVTGVLRHHPFVATFHDKVAEAVRSDRYGAPEEYRAYWAALEKDPDLTLRRPTARRYEGVDSLVDIGFLQASADYVGWVVSTSRSAPSSIASASRTNAGNASAGS